MSASILPEVLSGKNVIVTAHGNSLRALVMVLEGQDQESIIKRELETGAPLIYRLGPDARVIEQSGPRRLTLR